MTWIFNKKIEYTRPLEKSLLTKLKERGNAVILDTETISKGGFVEIIEIAILRWTATPELIASYKLNPTFHTKRVHQTALAWPDVAQQIESALNNKVILAYNAPFDRRAIEAERARWWRVYPDIRKELNWYDVAPLARQILKRRRTPSLTEAVNSLLSDEERKSVDHLIQHRAEDDVLLLAALLNAIEKYLQD